MAREDRLRKLLGLLREGRRTAATLARAFGVCVRTVYRDIEALGDRGVSIDATLGPGGGYRLASDDTVPLKLAEDDVCAAAMALRAAGNTALARSIVQALSTASSAHAHLLTLFEREAPTPSVSGDILKACIEGVHQRRLMWIRLPRGTNETRTRVFEPSALRQTNGGWALDGWDRELGAERSFDLREIESASVRRVRLPRAPTTRRRPLVPVWAWAAHSAGSTP